MLNGAPRGSARSLRALEWLNAIVADVRAGVGPYLAIYLRASRYWDPEQIGLAMSAMDLASVLGQTPAGGLTDRARDKRLLVVAAAVGVAAGSLLVVHSQHVPPVIAAQAVIGAMAALFPTAIAAITLGLVGPVRLPRQVGRNETWNHAGNIATAILAGLIGSYLAPEGIFYLVVALSIATIAVVLTIPGREIDPMEARGALDTEGLTHVSSVRALLMDRRIGIFGLCAVLFHFANAAMLPLLGQVLSLGKDHRAPLYMSACIITAQLVMVPVAAWAGRACAVYGRKWVLMIGFSVLPIRGVLYTLTADPIALIAVQVLDGAIQPHQRRHRHGDQPRGFAQPRCQRTHRPACRLRRGLPGAVRRGLDRRGVSLDRDAGDERCAMLGGPVGTHTAGDIAAPGTGEDDQRIFAQIFGVGCAHTDGGHHKRENELT